MSVIALKADIHLRGLHVCLVPGADIRTEMPLRARWLRIKGLVRRSLILTFHTGLKAGLAHKGSVVAAVHMSSGMDLAGIVELDRIAVPGHIGDLRRGEVAPRQMCSRGDSSP